MIDVSNSNTSYPDAVSEDKSLSNAWEKPINSAKIKIYISALACICICLLATFIFKSFSEQQSKSFIANVDNRNFMDVLFRNLRNKFPYQRKESYRVIRNAVMQLLKAKEPNMPSILNLMSFPEADKSAKCLAKYLAININNLLNNQAIVHIDAFQYKDNDPKTIKHKIENAVYDGFLHGKQVILIEHFEYIPAESVMIFHGLCDDTNAPFKRSIFIFTSYLSDSLRQKSLKEIGVTDHWISSISPEKRFALESRLGIGKLLIEREPGIIRYGCRA